jgi:hypothetical protein
VAPESWRNAARQTFSDIASGDGLSLLNRGFARQAQKNQSVGTELALRKGRKRKIIIIRPRIALDEQSSVTCQQQGVIPIAVKTRS